jgi:HEAT repeat protein
MLFAAASLIIAARAGGQDLAKRVAATDGVVDVIYPSRPAACGDGQGFIQSVLGENRWSGEIRSGRYETRVCVHGPARVAATVIGGEVTRLRLYIGPVPSNSPATRTITASAPEAVEWLSGLATRGAARVAENAIPPLVVADAPGPWPLLLRIARDDDRSRAVRTSALTWLSFGVIDHLGIVDADDRASDDDQMRSQAVFVLSQRPKTESVPELIDLARSSKYPAVRKAALFWLGQTGDRRASDVFAELLGLR